MDPLSPRQQALLELVGTLGREKFAPRAEKYDREAAFPFENYADLRAHNLLALCIPQSEGGWGADYRTYCLVSAELARYCPTTALTFNMHCCTMMWIGEVTDALGLPDEVRAVHARRRSAVYRRVVEEGALFAQPFSEGNQAAAGKTPFATTATRHGEGWLINGRKIFASLSGAADYYAVVVTEEKANATARDTLFIAIPKDAAGFSIVGEWDPLGMRGTVSRTLLLQNVFVTDDALLLPPGVYHQLAVRWPYMFFTLAPTYMGLSQAVFDFTVAYLRGEIPPMQEKRRRFPLKQAAVAELKIMLESARALFHTVIAEARLDPSKEARLRAYVAQYTIMENAARMAALAIRTCGGQSILRPLPLERMYRDARCGALMLPWTAEICIERLGRECLYEPGERDE
ncbi:MAG: acyl-CoA/acyl-ACP dehydrogenase [Candidatus Binatia bacterium]|nr:acyl-CoA/acyl-ACP dehydrogenase [Candidatus Binatia bacterium]